MPMLRMRIVADLKQVKSSLPNEENSGQGGGVEQVENAPPWGEVGQYYNI